MLKDVSSDKRYVRKYDPKKKMLHVWARGKQLPVCVEEGHEKAMDWDDVFGAAAKEREGRKIELELLREVGLYVEHTFGHYARRCSRCGVERKVATAYSCLPDLQEKMEEIAS